MSKEAMKLALGKIKSARDCHPNAVNTLLFEAEEILEEALEKPDFWEGYVPEPVKPATEESSATQAQQALDKKAENARELGLDYEPAQQEPVAYPEGDVVGPCICGSWPGGKCLKCPRITTPAQRTWVGLTLEEVDECFEFIIEDSTQAVRFYQAIEAKLKEKNT
jgi:hypothetical protein